jgi:glycerate kinase
MKILIATDSHKGCMTSGEAGETIASAVKLEMPDADIAVVPVSDGGE